MSHCVCRHFRFPDFIQLETPDRPPLNRQRMTLARRNERRCPGCRTWLEDVAQAKPPCSRDALADDLRRERNPGSTACPRAVLQRPPTVG